MGITRRALIGSASALVVAPLPPDGFIVLTDDGEHITSKMPAAETVVDVKLRDGSITRAWYDANIMEAGDWDFCTVGADDEPADDGESLADRIVAWRATST